MKSVKDLQQGDADVVCSLIFEEYQIEFLPNLFYFLRFAKPRWQQ